MRNCVKRKKIWQKESHKPVAVAVRLRSNVGAQPQQQVCTTLSAIFFSFYTVSHYIYLFVSQ